MKKKFKFTITMLICAGEGLFSFFQGNKQRHNKQVQKKSKSFVLCAPSSI